MKGPLIILSGPSGSGKSTLASRLLAMPELRLRQSVSATTRPPRTGEENGQHYFFLTPEEFGARRDAGEFLECAEVHAHCYGTPRDHVEQLRREGLAVVLVIDVQGAAQVRQACPEAVSIFLRTSTLDILERRLRARGSEDEASIQTRMTNARSEMARAGEYTYQVLNDDLEQAVRDVRTIILNHLPEAKADAR